MECLLYTRFRLYGENYYEGCQLFKLDKREGIHVECSIFVETQGTMLELIVWGEPDSTGGFDVMRWLEEEYL